MIAHVCLKVLPPSLSPPHVAAGDIWSDGKAEPGINWWKLCPLLSTLVRFWGLGKGEGWRIWGSPDEYHAGATQTGAMRGAV